MENPILLTWLNDFIFCPASIYFHNLYGDSDRISFQERSQINGTAAHSAIDTGNYSTRKNIICSMMVYSQKYGLLGKIDIFDTSNGKLVERKKHIQTIYDGYVFQLYGQCVAMREMGYDVKSLAIYSLDDNKSYPVLLPENDPDMFEKFKNLITDIKKFNLIGFKQTNDKKCRRCIYEPLCDSSLL
ncbi:MAG: type V CRISPR-associated protein Cas4 [Clostridiales bacterium]|nr:type V CRISPR-associated protein Cas4 [Clostridiales bacterium]